VPAAAVERHDPSERLGRAPEQLLVIEAQLRQAREFPARPLQLVSAYPRRAGSMATI
jgi:hypothetical protein